MQIPIGIVILRPRKRQVLIGTGLQKVAYVLTSSAECPRPVIECCDLISGTKQKNLLPGRKISLDDKGITLFYLNSNVNFFFFWHILSSQKKSKNILNFLFSFSLFLFNKIRYELKQKVN